ncbi:hypothetical protein [Rhizobium sp. BK376]|uniref:hypothetical protein n=1 Tax=Rhizobium sp. BK376 TaxID=2512149 RepID=UPI001A9D96BD|nr:hypothetical protein [Rhizobium sp. BK376]
MAEGYFIWINTNAAPHGLDQLEISAGCHELIKHDSHIDLSRLVKHPDWELDSAKEFPCISVAMCKEIIARIDDGLDLLPPRHAEIIKANLNSLLG